MLQNSKIITCQNCGLQTANRVKEVPNKLVCPRCKNIIFQRNIPANPVVVPIEKLQPKVVYGYLRLEDPSISETKIWEINARSVTVGRKHETSTADLQLDIDDEFMSREHFKLTIMDNNEATILDEKSTGGTKLNDKLIGKGVYHVIQENDEITIGKTRLLFFLNIHRAKTRLVNR